MSYSVILRLPNANDTLITLNRPKIGKLRSQIPFYQELSQAHSIILRDKDDCDITTNDELSDCFAEHGKQNVLIKVITIPRGTGRGRGRRGKGTRRAIHSGYARSPSNATTKSHQPLIVPTPNLNDFTHSESTQYESQCNEDNAESMSQRRTRATSAIPVAQTAVLPQLNLNQDGKQYIDDSPEKKLLQKLSQDFEEYKSNFNGETIIEYEWKWKDDDDIYKLYEPDISNKLNRLAINQSLTFSTYTITKISVDTAKQINTKTQKQRKVSRFSISKSRNVGSSTRGEIVIPDSVYYHKDYQKLSDAEIKQLFFETVSTEYEIVGIEDVSNEAQNFHYELNLWNKCNELRKSRDEVEKYLWHGSSYDITNIIIQNGFDREYSATADYGKGIYFRRDARYNCNSSHSLPDPDGYQYILLNKVIGGDSTVGSRAMTKVPLKPNGVEYDTLVDNILNPSVYVIWRDFTAIPVYRIKFKKKGNIQCPSNDQNCNAAKRRNYEQKNNNNDVDKNDENDESNSDDPKSKLIHDLTKVNEYLVSSNQYLASFVLKLLDENRKLRENGDMVKTVNTVKNKKRKKRKKKNKCEDNVNDIESSRYDPPSSCRAVGNVQISRDITESIVPTAINERISNVFGYMDRACALSLECEHINNGKKIRVINYDFHDKNGRVLYGVLEPWKQKDFKWKMENGLFTADEMEEKYNIPRQQLPKSTKVSNDTILSQKASINDLLNNEQALKDCIKKTDWNKISVFSRTKQKNTKSRTTQHLTKLEFSDRCIEFIEKEKKPTNAIPIIMFNGKNNHWIEFVKIFRIDTNIDIGISFKQNTKNGRIMVGSIHLEKSSILEQHELLMPQHAANCHCLDGFESHINDLRIGNLDEDLNKVKHWKAECAKRKAFIEAFIINGDSLANHVMHMLPSRNYISSPWQSTPPSPNTVKEQRYKPAAPPPALQPVSTQFGRQPSVSTGGCCQYSLYGL